jgi:hypothetical protein
MAEIKYYSWQNWDLEELIKSICTRPNMFVNNADLYHVAAFIDGFTIANETTYRESREFGVWLAEKLNFPPNWVWWSGLRKKYPNDEEALRELPKLFQEFREKRSV